MAQKRSTSVNYFSYSPQTTRIHLAPWGTNLFLYVSVSVFRNSFSPILQKCLRDIPLPKRQMYINICCFFWVLKTHASQYLYFRIRFGVYLPSLAANERRPARSASRVWECILRIGLVCRTSTYKNNSDFTNAIG